MLTYVETLRILTLDRQKVRPLIDKVSHSCNGFFAIFLCLFCCPLLCNDFDHLLVYNALISLHWLSTKFHHLLALPSYILHSTCYPFQHKKVLVAHPIHILKRCRIHATTGGSFRKVGAVIMMTMMIMLMMTKRGRGDVLHVHRSFCLLHLLLA